MEKLDSEQKRPITPPSSEYHSMLKCFRRSSTEASSPPPPNSEQKHVDVASDSDTVLPSKRKPGGWRAMPFIIGNETFERLAAFGLLANFMVYLMREYHMEQVTASNMIYIWSGVSNFAPLIGAFISDAYVGRFRTIAFASVASFLGMVAMTLTAWIPQLHPPPCAKQQQSLVGQCKQASRSQLGFLIMGLGFLSIGSGGIRPCSIPFGVDQFDPTTDEGRKGINSFFNWYYTSFTVVLLITQTLVVYIQDSVSWVLGFGIPTILMFCSILLFFVGTNIYVHTKPEGSIFSSVAQVFVAAHKKRKLKFPEEVELNGVLYDPPLKGTTVITKLPLTKEFRYFTKAAIILENELNPDGTPINKWRLCSIQQVEEVKRIIRIVPIWASGIISLVAITQQGTFIVSQALKMDRHLGPKFQIPAGSINVVSFLTVGLWLPFYDRVVVPALRKITKHEGGITLLQRIGIGIVFAVLSMIVAALVERERRSMANSHKGLAPMSVFWLAPQLILLGFCEAFNILGQIEFFNRQFPEHMMSVGNALFACSFALANYLSSFTVTIIHHATGKNGRPDWLANDIDAGRLEYFFYLVAGIGVLNLVYFLYVANRYVYKGSVKDDEDKAVYVDVELSSLKA